MVDSDAARGMSEADRAKRTKAEREKKVHTPLHDPCVPALCASLCVCARMHPRLSLFMFPSAWQESPLCSFH
jgi:hypothetical protein